ncbi:MAG: DUF6371 domain-containing protein, partial [Bacteroidales bacterium]
DHKNSCGYHLPPKEYKVFNDLRDFKNFRPIQKKEIPICEIDPYYLKLSLKCEIMSDFETFLRSRFTQEEVDKAVERYFLSSNKDGHVVYWQIDNLSRIRTGKIMAYNPITGKRLKQPQQLNNSTTQHLTWVHSELKRQMLLDKDWQLSQCLFGLHLLNQFPNQRVNIVEGEKTAVIMSIFLPEELWMSTGGFDGLNKEKLMPLKGRQIRLFPDLGCYDGWLVKAEEIMRESGLKIGVSKCLEQCDKDLGLKDGDDLADLYLSFKF